MYEYKINEIRNDADRNQSAMPDVDPIAIRKRIQEEQTKNPIDNAVRNNAVMNPIAKTCDERGSNQRRRRRDDRIKIGKRKNN